jgi:hypothetical protein
LSIQGLVKSCEALEVVVLQFESVIKKTRMVEA